MAWPADHALKCTALLLTAGKRKSVSTGGVCP